MELGTHNSMTYLPLKNWWMYPFNWLAKCQSKTIEEQFNKGIRVFDIRISYDKNSPVFKHGLARYKGNVYSILRWLDNKNESIKIRLILETNKEDKIKECNFISDCYRFIAFYKNLTFYEGRRKFDWKPIVNFPSLEVNQLISSMAGKGIYKLCPWLYAKVHNKKNLKNYKDNKILLIDFI